MINYFFLLGLFLFFPYLSNLYAQTIQSARSHAFDRGLVDISEPYAPVGNPALLASRSFFRFNGELHSQAQSAYLVSLSNPVSVGTALGLAGYVLTGESVKNLMPGFARINQNKQTFLLSLGHNRNGIKWGQQLEGIIESEEINFFGDNGTTNLQFGDTQNITLGYRMGFFHALGNNLSVGFLSPPIVRYKNRTFIDSDRKSDSTVRFWQENESNTIIPMLALRWQALESLSLAVSNRSREGEKDFQFAANTKFLGNFDLTAAFNLERETDTAGAIFGIGGYIKGLDAYVSYDIKNTDLKFSVSFTPESSKELISLEAIQPTTLTLYPYRLAGYNPQWLLRVKLLNQTNKHLEVNIKLAGEGLPSMVKGAVLESSESSFVEFPVPLGVQSLPAGAYNYNIEVTAFQRGRQILNRQFSFEMKDTHDWSGNSDDLRYFVQANHVEIIERAREILADNGINHDILSPVNIAKYFYQYLKESFRYINDPIPAGARQDRVQYATETMDLKSGDCEDLTILMASLLESVGIQTAFIEVFPPDSPEGHILIMFDSAHIFPEVVSVGGNLQRYIVRQNGVHQSQLFIPVELTRLDLSFEEAQLQALHLYQYLGIDQNGLAGGWVRIIDSIKTVNQEIN